MGQSQGDVGCANATCLVGGAVQELRHLGPWHRVKHGRILRWMATRNPVASHQLREVGSFFFHYLQGFWDKSKRWLALGSSEPSTVTRKWAAGTPVTFAYPLSFGTFGSMVFLFPWGYRFVPWRVWVGGPFHSSCRGENKNREIFMYFEELVIT